MATRSARRPEGKDSSLTQAKPNDRSRRSVPRAIASAVSDWRPSGSGTRLRFWADDSIAGQHRTGCKKWKQVSYQGFRASFGRADHVRRQMPEHLKFSLAGDEKSALCDA